MHLMHIYTFDPNNSNRTDPSKDSPSHSQTSLNFETSLIRNSRYYRKLDSGSKYGTNFSAP